MRIPPHRKCQSIDSLGSFNFYSFRLCAFNIQQKPKFFCVFPPPTGTDTKPITKIAINALSIHMHDNYNSGNNSTG